MAHKVKKEEFEMRKSARKFARKVNEKFSLEMALANGQHIPAKKRIRDTSEEPVIQDAIDTIAEVPTIS